MLFYSLIQVHKKKYFEYFPALEAGKYLFL